MNTVFVWRSLASASALGAESREFKSLHEDHYLRLKLKLKYKVWLPSGEGTALSRRHINAGSSPVQTATRAVLAQLAVAIAFQAIG
jgi:hypothetical protein